PSGLAGSTVTVSVTTSSIGVATTSAGSAGASLSGAELSGAVLSGGTDSVVPPQAAMDTTMTSARNSVSARFFIFASFCFIRTLSLNLIKTLTFGLIIGN